MSHFFDLDKTNRELALDSKHSFIIQAPAGSGKTELLIQRFLALLATVNSPQEVLAITFTKKAANEMRDRLIKSLHFAATHSEPESTHEKKTWQLSKTVLLRDKMLKWNLLNNSSQLRIQTIDSLCAYLTKQLPLLSQMGSQANVTDYPIMIYSESIQEVLTHIEEKFEWSQSLAILLTHLDNDLNKLHYLLINLLAKRDQWLPYISLSVGDDAIKLRLESFLKEIIENHLKLLKQYFSNETLSKLLAVLRFSACNLKSYNDSSLFSSLENIDSLPNDSYQLKNCWQAIASLLLTKSFSFRKKVDEDIGFPPLHSLKSKNEKAIHQAYRQQLSEIILSLKDNEALRIALSEVFYLPDLTYREDQWNALKALLTVLKVTVAQLRLTFQKHGQIDFIENAQAALLALGDDENPTDLTFALDYQIKHILIDEFQDTSISQYQLIEKLIMGWENGDGRTLFIVGDPMQSIYRFREAEVSLFIKTKQNGIGNLKLTPLALSLNFRSSQAIVEWINDHFQTIFPAKNEMSSGAISYHPSMAFHRTSNKKDLAVIIQGFISKNNEAQIQSIIKAIHENNKDPKETIAILVRSRSHLPGLIAQLKKEKIAYSAIDIDPLTDRQSVQDLLSLTCALLHPFDRIAWLSILRAPWCGLTLEDLLIISNDPYSSIWEQLNNMEQLEKLSLDGQTRLMRILPVLKAKMTERGRTHLRHWIESTWILLGGPACLNDISEIEDAHTFFTLLESLSESNQSIQIHHLKDKMKQLYATTNDPNANVHIMTIHSAKGLEFDTVILPNIDKKISSDEKPLLIWMEQPLKHDRSGLLIGPIQATGDEPDSIYEFIFRKQKIKSDHEINRLFYVAATRAKKKLYLFFNAEKDQHDHIKINPGSFLSKLWPHLKEQHQLIQEITIPFYDENQLSSSSKRYLKRLSKDWQHPIHHDPTHHYSRHQKQTGFLLPDERHQIIGTVLHKLFQQLAKQGTTWWHNHLHQDAYLKKQLTLHGLLTDSISEFLPYLITTIDRALKDPRCQWILQKWDNAASELPLTAIINGNIEKLVIDRTFIDENNERWIIDYKFSILPETENIDALLKKEREKYLDKMNHYQTAMQLIDERPIHLGLYFPLHPAWIAWRA